MSRREEHEREREKEEEGGKEGEREGEEERKAQKHLEEYCCSTDVLDKLSLSIYAPHASRYLPSIPLLSIASVPVGKGK
jgi:hypothetical protein